MNANTATVNLTAINFDPARLTNVVMAGIRVTAGAVLTTALIITALNAFGVLHTWRDALLNILGV